jgi:TonB-dependent receptor
MGLNKHKKLKRKFLFIISILLTLQFVTASTLKYQNTNYEFPAELLESRLIKIEKLTKSNISFDSNLVKEVKVPALSIKNETVEKVLTRTLSTTNFMYEKVSNTSFVIVEGKFPIKSQQTGSIKGTIVDDKGLPIPGVNIKVLETEKSTQSDLTGSYSLSVQPGAYTIEFTILSFRKLKVTRIVVVQGKITPLNVVLEESKNVLNEVQVTSNYRKATAASLFALQKRTISFTDGISAQQIKQTSDNNVAQVLKRVSGVTMQDNKFIVVRGMSERYNNVQLNGSSLPSTEPNRRNFSFDIIPTNLIDNVIVAKTFTPDMSAEFAGGTVQVNTLSVPQEKFLTLSLGSAYNTQSFGKDLYSNTRYAGDYFLGTTSRDWLKNGWLDEYKKVFLKEEPGVINPNIQEQHKLASELPNHWGLQKLNGKPTQSFAITGGMPFKLRDGSMLGFTSAVNYRNEEEREDYEWRARSTNDFSTDGIKSSFVTVVAGLLNMGWRGNNHRVDFRNLYNRRFTHDNFRQSITSDGDFGYSLRINSSPKENTLWQTRLDGEHKFINKKLIVNWFADFNQVIRYQPEDRFNTAKIINTTGDVPVYQWLGLGSITNDVFNVSGIIASLLKEKKQNVGGNIEYNFKIAGNNQKIKTGYWGTFRNADFQQAILLVYGGSAVTPNVLPIQELFAPSNFASGAQIFRPFYSQGGDTKDLKNKDNYAGKQVVDAGYLMGDFTFFKKLHFIGGMRFEAANMEIDTYFSKRILLPGGVTQNKPVDTLLIFKEKNWLPSLNVTYDALPSLKLRMAYSKTLARADFKERAPFLYYDFYERVQVGGSAGLLNPNATNYDMRLEWYPSAGEIISIGGFRKDFTNPIEVLANLTTDGNDLATYTNLIKANVEGIEFNLRKHFGFLSTPLENLYLSGNMTMLRGRITLAPVLDENGVQSIPVQDRDRSPNGLSPLSWNAGLSYDLDNIGATINYNYVGEKIRFAGSSEQADIYDAPRGTLDTQLRFKLIKSKMELRLNASDIIAQPSIIYRNPYSGVAGGVLQPINGKEYNEGEDIVLRKVYAGTTYSFTVSYNF